MAAAMDVNTAQMVLSENVRMQWRAWQSYLHARQVLMASADGVALAASAAEPSFVRDTDTAAQRRADAEAQLKLLTADQRTLFDRQVVAMRGRIHEELRTAHRAKGLREDGFMLDPDDLTRQALTRLLDACEGRGVVYPGMGDTPMPGDMWYQIKLGELNTVSDALFSLATGKGGAKSSLRSTFVVIGGMLALLTVYLVTLNWPGTAAPTAAAAILVDATPSPRWVTTRVLLTTAVGETTAALVRGTGAGWAGAPDQATLRDDQVYPVALCLPAAQLADLTALTLHGDDGHASDRRYQLATLAPAQPDMVLIACGSSPGAPRYGTLADTLPPVDQALGSAATLSDGTQVALLAVATQGQASGQGQIQLVLTVQGLGGSVVAYNPTVQVETGEMVTTPQRVAAESAAAADTQQISYALSAADLPRTAIWSITDPGTGQVYRWRITIAPPPTADALLAQRLQISAVQAQRTSPGLITLTLTLVNQSDAPLTVTATDLTLSRGGGPLPTPVFAAVTLVPGTTRTVTLAVPLSSGQELVIHLAGQSFQIRD